MKRIWSAFVSCLLLVLVLMFFGFAAYSSTHLPIKLGAAAMGLCFLITFIAASQADGRLANKLVKALNVAAGVLFAAALALIVQHYFNTMHLA